MTQGVILGFLYEIVRCVLLAVVMEPENASLEENY